MAKEKKLKPKFNPSSDSSSRSSSKPSDRGIKKQKLLKIFEKWMEKYEADPKAWGESYPTEGTFVENLAEQAMRLCEEFNVNI